MSVFPLFFWFQTQSLVSDLVLLILFVVLSVTSVDFRCGKVNQLWNTTSPVHFQIPNQI
jgi:hypothetical protein